MTAQEALFELKIIAEKDNVPIIKDDSLNVLLLEIKKNSPKRVLEIGTAIGYSGIAMLSMSDDMILDTIEIDVDRYAIAKRYINECGYINRVHMYLDDACEVVRYLQNKYDFVFLDGPKGHYAQMLPYITDLLHSGGVVFADNILFYGKTLKEGYPEHKHRTIVNSLRSFIDEMTCGNTYDSNLLNIGDGIIIGKKR